MSTQNTIAFSWVSFAYFLLLCTMQLFNLPNILTLINLLAGCGALIALFNYQADKVIYFTGISLIADFFDGMAARALKINSPIGKELDSLADVVSFGMVPGAALYFILNNSFRANATADTSDLQPILFAFPAFLFVLFAALRLAKFNVDERQTQGFIGLATPAATIFVIGLLEIYLHNSFGWTETVSQPFFLYSCIAFLCYAMICELPMFSFKLKNIHFAENKTQFAFLAISAVFLVLFRTAAFPLIILLYIFASFIVNRISKK